MSEQAIITLKNSYDLKKLNKFNFHKNLMSHKSVTEVDTLVARLVDHYKHPEFIPLFRKAAWYLSEATLVLFTEKSAGKSSPVAYFATCVKNELLKNT